MTNPTHRNIALRLGFFKSAKEYDDFQEYMHEKAEKERAKYRIEDIQKATVNGRAVKLFKAYELQGDAYVFIGQFAAPQKTANKNLSNFIVE